MARKVLGKRLRDAGYLRPAKRFRRGRKLRGRRGKGNGIYTKLLRQPVPDRQLTKLRYCESLNAAIISPAIFTYYLYRSSLYDPDYTGTGHQPLWRDELVTLYERYRVLGIKYRFTIHNSNTQFLGQGVVRYTNSTTPETNYMTVRERNNVKRFTLGSWASKPVVIKGYMPVGKPWGMTKKDVMHDEDFEALMGTNPIKTSYIALYLFAQTNSCTFHVQSDLEYYVELSDRKMNTGS